MVKIGRRFAACLAVFATVYGADVAFADGPRVVASIGPVHSLVAGVMQGIGSPTLLVPGNASPHTFALKPSDAAALDKADVIFWIGEGLEGFLVKPLASLGKKAKAVELAEVPGVTMLDRRKGGPWPGHDHDHDEKHAKKKYDHDHGKKAKEEKHDHAHEDGKDAHLWLDPANGRAIVAAVVAALTEKDPTNAARYRTNGDAVAKRLAALEGELKTKLAPVANQPFIVFHDGYQYFEKQFGLNGVGAITVDPERRPGARTLKNLRDRIKSAKAVCVFSEPQFEPKLVRSVIEGTKARTGVLDPVGAGVAPGPELYGTLLRNMADAFVGCLSASAK